MGSINLFKRFIFSSKAFSTMSLTPKLKTFNPRNRPNIIRLDYNDKIFRNALLVVKSRKTRMESGLILIEGMRLLKDILNTDKKPLMVFVSRTEDAESLNLDPETKLYKVPYNDMKLWSDVVTPQGIMGCVDPWELKVLRSGSGAHFKIPIETNLNWDDMAKNLKRSSLFALATNRINSKSNIEDDIPLKPYFGIDYNKFSNIVMVIGGETEGLSENVFQVARNFNVIRINIPLNNDVESLNAASAASVILFEVKKQLLNSTI